MSNNISNNSVESTTLLDISKIQTVSIEYDFEQPTFKDVSTILHTICDKNDPNNYHCRKLGQFLFCTVNQEKYKNDPFLCDYCERNYSHPNPNWHTDYHIRHLLEEHRLSEGCKIDSNGIIQNEQVNFVQKMDKMAQNYNTHKQWTRFWYK